MNQSFYFSLQHISSNTISLVSLVSITPKASLIEPDLAPEGGPQRGDLRVEGEADGDQVRKLAQGGDRIQRKILPC